MPKEEKLVKVNKGYLLLYILAPLVIFGVCAAVSIGMDLRGTAAGVLFMAPLLLAIFWWSIGGTMVYNRRKKGLAAALEARGFVRNQTFNSDGCTVVVDMQHGQLAMLFRWNPFRIFVVPASRITRAWVEDGRGGAGFLEGSSRVGFLFTVDGIKVRANTFTSNKRWRMDSEHILTGISKADMMVEVLEAARARSAGERVG